MANGWGKSRNSKTLYFLVLQNHCRQKLLLWNLKTLAPWKKNYDKPRQCTKKQRHSFVNKGLYSQSYGFSSSHVWMWELDLKAECRRIDAFELWCWRRLLRVPWTARISNPSILKKIKFIGRNDGKAQAPVLWPSDAKSWLIWKDPDTGKDWGQEEKGATEDEMVG